MDAPTQRRMLLDFVEQLLEIKASGESLAEKSLAEWRCSSID